MHAVQADRAVEDEGSGGEADEDGDEGGFGAELSAGEDVWAMQGSGEEAFGCAGS